MRLSRIFILLVFVDAVRCQCGGNHVNLTADVGAYRYLQSPNYGDEHGKRTNNCAWIINLPSPKHYVLLHVEDLRLHYLDYLNNIHCMSSYDLRINGEKFGCDPDQFVSTEKNEFCIQFRTPTCAELKTCSKIRQTLDKVQITFSTSGQRVKPGQTPIVIGFRIRYGIFQCPRIGASITNGRTTVTRTSLAASTQRPFNTFPGDRNSVGRPQATESTPRRTTVLSIRISTVRTTTTTNAETNKAIPTSSKSLRISSAKTDPSNEIPIGVSHANNATRGLQLASTASPTANKSRGEDDFDTKLSFTIDLHWIILASALGGGLILILVVAICCKIQRNKKSKVESEETDTADCCSNHDKTEAPAYATLEDVSSNQKSSQQEATNQNAMQTDSKLDEKLVVENVAYESPQESPTTSISQPDSTMAESIQNDEDKPTIIDEPGDEFYSVVRLKSNNEKTTVRYLKENILYSEAP